LGTPMTQVFKVNKGRLQNWRNLQLRVDSDRLARFKKLAEDNQIGTSELFAQIFDFAVAHLEEADSIEC